MSARRRERPPIIYNLKVENRVTGEALGYLVDVNAKGMRLIAESPAAASDERKLRVHLPNNTMDEAPLDLTAALRWCKPQSEGTYAIGMEFLEVPETAATTVRELIRRFQETPDESPDDPYLQNLDPSDIEP